MRLLDHPQKDLLVAEWVRLRIPHMEHGGFGAPLPGGRLPYVAYGVIGGPDRVTMLGGVVFHNYVPAYRSIEWSAASVTPCWLNREIISDILSYPFGKLGCARITAIIPKPSGKPDDPAQRACDFHWRFGFKHEGTVRRLFGGRDAFIFGLLASEWRKSRFNTHREDVRQTVKA